MKPTLFLSVNLLVLLYNPILFSQKYNKTIEKTFEIKDFKIIETNNEYTDIYTTDLKFSINNKAGDPALPYTVINILVPSDINTVNYKVKQGKYLFLGKYKIRPVPNPAPVELFNLSLEEFPAKYIFTEFPEKQVLKMGSSLMGGYRYVSFAFYPFRFNTVNNDLFLFRK
jgi:hypothetical protein